MASAAPSPAAVEGGGQEQVVAEKTSAEGGGTGGEGGSDGGAPGEVAPKEVAPRQRKTSMPGVLRRDDSDDLFPDLGFKSKTGKRVSRRDAEKELDAELKAETGIQLDIPDLPEDAKPAEEKPKPQKIKFADKEYESIEGIEQEFKSLRGMFKPMQDRMAEAESVAQKAADSARAWRERAIALEQGTAPPPTSTPQPQTPPAPTSTSARAELDKALENVNGELFEQLAREHGLPLAGRYLASQVLATVHDQMLPALRKEIMDTLMPTLEPLQQDRGFQQATQHVSALIETVGQYKSQDGSVAFPELNSAETMYEVGELWRSMDMPPELALTDKGLIQAVALYRMYKGQTSTPQSVTTTPVPEVSRPAATAPPAAGQSLEATGGASPVRMRGESDMQRFARELTDAPLVDRTLGFAVRRRN